MSTTQRERYEVIRRLQDVGISYEDAHRLRRIAMTLQRWFELECGDGNEYGSWMIARDKQTDKPYMVHHHYIHNTVTQCPTKSGVARYYIADREKGAKKRLATMMEKYPTLTYYIQTDPRGASLWILETTQAQDYPIEQIYTRGIAVY